MTSASLPSCSRPLVTGSSSSRRSAGVGADDQEVARLGDLGGWASGTSRCRPPGRPRWSSGSCSGPVRRPGTRRPARRWSRAAVAAARNDGRAGRADVTRAQTVPAPPDGPGARRRPRCARYQDPATAVHSRHRERRPGLPCRGPHRVAEPLAVVGGRLCTDLVEVTSDLTALDGSGFWAVVLPFDGAPVCARFATVRPASAVARCARGRAPTRRRWTSSLDHDAFVAGVGTIREEIAAGDVYQVNLTRRLRAPLPGPGAGPLRRHRRARGRARRRQPGAVSAPWCACPATASRSRRASPERFLSRATAARSGPHRSRAPRRRRTGFLPQGPRRERDDRRPRAQRPGPGLRVGLGARAVAARRRAAPRAVPPGQHRRGPAASRASAGPRRSRPRSRPGRSPAHPSWRRSSRSPASSPSPAASTAARSAGSTRTATRAT